MRKPIPRGPARAARCGRVPAAFWLSWVLAAILPACGGKDPTSPSWLRGVARASGEARRDRAAEAAARFCGGVGTALLSVQSEDPEFAASAEGAAAAAAVLDAVAPGRSDASIVKVADAASGWPLPVRVAALSALARLAEPAAAPILTERASPLDAGEESFAAAWIRLAEALPGIATEAAVVSVQEPLLATAERQRTEGHGDVAARLEALAARVAAVAGPQSPARGAAALSPSEGWRALARAKEEADEAQGPDAARLLEAVEDEAKTAVARWTEAKAATSPADRLALARTADLAHDGAALRRALATFSKDAGDEARVATTWLATLDLEDKDVSSAFLRVDRIAREFDGRGANREGREIPVSALAAGVTEAAADEARARVEGPSPDREAAGKALAAGRAALALAAGDEETRARLDSAAAWVDLLSAPDADVRALAPFLVPKAAPRVVAFADHFQTMEPILPSVLKRWAKGVDVEVVGILVGSVRGGMRRIPVRAREERDALATRAKELGLPLSGTVGLHADAPLPPWLGGRPAAVFVFGADGRVLARLSGAALDPRVLDPVVQTVSRDPAATAPPR